MGRLPVVLAILALVCASAGCTTPLDNQPLPPPPTSGTPPTTGTPLATGTPPYPGTAEPSVPVWRPSAEADEAACRKADPQPWNPGNDPYLGPGPHYVYPVEVQLDPGEPENALDSKDFALPADMMLDRSRYPSGWQLIACVYDGRPTTRAGTVTCTFTAGEKGPKTFPFYESRYEVIVREASTGKQVTRLDLAGTATVEKSCPSAVFYDSKTVILRGLAGAELGRALRPVFQGAK